MTIFLLLFIFAVLHLSTILLSRELKKSEELKIVSYLGSIVMTGLNVIKYILFFFIIYQIVILLGNIKMLK